MITTALRCLAVMAGLACGLAASPPPFPIREHYTKYEYRVPMRDGVHLFTAVYVPKEAAGDYPFLLNRTCYAIAPYGPDEYRENIAPGDAFLKAGYIFVVQDVRGRGMSEGIFQEATPTRAARHEPAGVDESTDTSDTVEWLIHHVPGNNGRVGVWGQSYPGFYTSAGIIDSHPAIKAAAPAAPVADFYLNDDWYHGGAFMLLHTFEFYTGFKPRARPAPPAKTDVPFDPDTADSYDFFLRMGPLKNALPYFAGKSEFWDADVGHPNYDAYWQARAVWRHLKNIHCAVLNVGGWYDAEDLMGTLRTHQAIGANNPGIYNGLVMGPWVHGGWARAPGRRLGSVDFAADTGSYYRNHLLFPFFEQHLKDRPGAALPAATVFETGTNVWRQYPAWPAPQARPRTLYFQANGGLSFDPPSDTAESSDRYVSDPAHPVPFLGYTAWGMPQEYMVSDQRFAARRPDVLVYSTPPLEEDVTMAGPLTAKLFVATSGTDSDWVVKLIDVYPPDRSSGEAPVPSVPRPPGGPQHIDDVPPPSIELAGYQQLVRGEPFRGKFRNGFEHPEAMEPGKVQSIHFTLPDVNHAFRRGHRIMIQVQSSWFPLVDRNPQTFVDIPNAAAADYQPATEQVFRSKAHPSGLEADFLPAP